MAKESRSPHPFFFFSEREKEEKREINKNAVLKCNIFII